MYFLPTFWTWYSVILLVKFINPQRGGCRVPVAYVLYATAIVVSLQTFQIRVIRWETGRCHFVCRQRAPYSSNNNNRSRCQHRGRRRRREPRLSDTTLPPVAQPPWPKPKRLGSRASCAATRPAASITVYWPATVAAGFSRGASAANSFTGQYGELRRKSSLSLECDTVDTGLTYTTHYNTIIRNGSYFYTI